MTKEGRSQSVVGYEGRSVMNGGRSQSGILGFKLTHTGVSTHTFHLNSLKCVLLSCHLLSTESALLRICFRTFIITHKLLLYYSY
jgi:hypothetical protein